MKRSGVRTRTLGVRWEERFLEAVRKARERKLVPPEAAEKLRVFAGVYFCRTCDKEHRTESKLGREHFALQPAPQATEPAITAKGRGAKAPRRGGLKARRAQEEPAPPEAAPLPVQLVASAKAAKAGPSATLKPRGKGTLERVRAAARKATGPALREAQATAKAAPRRAPASRPTVKPARDQSARRKGRR